MNDEYTDDYQQQMHRIKTGRNQWIHDTFLVIPKGSADDHFSSQPPVHGRPTKFWLFTNSREILIRSSHDRIDGIGGLVLLDDLIHGIVYPAEEAITKFSVGDDLKICLRLSGLPHSCQPQQIKICKRKKSSWLKGH